MERNSIDLGTVKVSRLFRKYFIPTLIGMLNIAVATTVEGVFVGHKLGNDGIAAVNLVIPLMLLFTGIGLMLGIGCSVGCVDTFGQRQCQGGTHKRNTGIYRRQFDSNSSVAAYADIPASDGFDFRFVGVINAHDGRLPGMAVARFTVQYVD